MARFCSSHLFARLSSCLRQSGTDQSKAFLLCLRYLSDTSTDTNYLKRAVSQGIPVRAVAFEVSPKEAAKRFESWQLSSCYGLNASGLVGGKIPGQGKLEPLYLPFWAFDVDLSARARGVMKVPSPSEKSEAGVRELPDWHTVADKQWFSHEEFVTQVYASYTFPRYFAQAAAVLSQSIASAQSLTLDDAGALNRDALSSRDSICGSTPVVHELEMKQAVAWQLCRQNLIRQLSQKAKGIIGASEPGSEVVDVRLELNVHSMRPVIMYLPVYLAEYTYGLRYRRGAAITVPHEYTALIGGTREGTLVCPVHVSPFKAQALALALLGAPLAANSMLQLWTLTTEGLALTAFVIGLLTHTAGWLVRRQPHVQSNEHDEQQIKEEKAFRNAFKARQDLHGGDSVKEAADTVLEQIWANWDWKNWEGQLTMKPTDRRRRAEELVIQHASRAAERARYVKRTTEAAAREEFETHQEQERVRRFGRSHPFGAAHGHSHGHAEAHPHGHRSHGRRDFLGYYRLLGIGMEVEVNAESIKAAYVVKAMELHPDKHANEPQRVQEDAAKSFRRLQTAYEVLRDPEKRQLYDRGQLFDA